MKQQRMSMPGRTRWKWMSSATAVAASAPLASAGLVQITQTGNQISTASGNTISADLTGDLIGDIVVGSLGVGFFDSYAYVYLGGVEQFASHSSFADPSSRFNVQAGGIPTYTSSSVAQIATGLIQLTFTDAAINGGQPTEGLAEIVSTNFDSSSHRVEITRLIFDDASTSLTGPFIPGSPALTEFSAVAVPEPSASLLALLALGGSGIFARRRRSTLVDRTN